MLAVGLAAGWLASLVVKTGFSLLGYLVVGIIGSYIGGFIFEFLDIRVTGLGGQILSAAVGAMVFLFVLNRLRR